MLNTRGWLSATVLVLSSLTLVACGDDDGTDAVEKEVEKVTGDNDVDLKGGSPLDAAGYAIASVQSQKYEDYEVDGDRVLLKVRKGVELAGSECVIIDAATGTDYPDVTWVLVESDGTETAC